MLHYGPSKRKICHDATDNINREGKTMLDLVLCQFLHFKT